MTEAQTHYLRLWKAADDILKENNPCEIQMVDGKAHCQMTRENKRFAPPGELCCGGCDHLGDNGCTVKALFCKVGWCFSSRTSIEGMKTEDHPTFIKIRELRQEAIKLDVPLRFRRSFEETFGDQGTQAPSRL